jgi:two-component system sensor histidine kinase/response regulator
MLTSSGQRGDAAKCRELGINAYLSKPVRQSELRTAIAEVLHKSKQPAAPLVTRHSLRENLSKFKILLVEDNPVNQKLIVRLLEKRGHLIKVAADGREAVNAFNQEYFDAILMDVQMPEMNGYEATAKIRDLELLSQNHIPIIAMTANAMTGDREKCLESGMDGYISKPIKSQELFDTLEQLMIKPDDTEKIQQGHISD